MEETALFSGKIYTADKNFTRPPVATVATNSKSAGSDAISAETYGGGPLNTLERGITP